MKTDLFLKQHNICTVSWCLPHRLPNHS